MELELEAKVAFRGLGKRLALGVDGHGEAFGAIEEGGWEFSFCHGVGGECVGGDVNDEAVAFDGRVFLGEAPVEGGDGDEGGFWSLGFLVAAMNRGIGGHGIGGRGIGGRRWRHLYVGGLDGEG